MKTIELNSLNVFTDDGRGRDRSSEIVPLEFFEIPNALSGLDGSNRADCARMQIEADNDLEAVHAWLSRFSATPTTYENYRKESERMLLWCIFELGKPLSSVTHNDWLKYVEFLSNPTPTARWVSPNGRKFARGDVSWRPFSGALSQSSIRQAGVILNAMFSWLVRAGYLTGNPLALSRERERHATKRITRYLEDEVWCEVKATIESMSRDTPRELEQYHRLRWLFSLMYICGLRISEVVGTNMGDFFRRRDRDGTNRWWLEVVGKGNKVRIVPATSELMAELADYRCLLGLSSLPVMGEPTPLLLPIGGKVRRLTRGGVHAIVKGVFETTAARLRARGQEYEMDAQRLMQASAHWLRHTAGSHMANNKVDLRHVRDNLGHQSISTSNVYLHSSDDARHAATEHSHRISW